ncbi:hypothetical protein ScPMuIL_004397 [Solemya velum]
MDQKLNPKVITVRSRRCNKKRRVKKPWWNEELTILWNDMCKAENKFVNNESITRSVRRSIFIQKRKVFDRAVQKHKRDYWYQKQISFEQIRTNNPREFWKEFGKTGVGNERKNYIPWETVLNDGSISSNYTEVLNKWKSDFCDLLNPVIDSNIVNGRSASSLKYLTQRLQFKLATTDDIFGICSQRPKYPRYAVLAVRISSFENWPVYRAITPQSLALAGLFYIGFGDNVKCFFCGGGLRNWEPQDIPWVEHARWYPRCAFLVQCQGQEFVQKVQGQLQEPEKSKTVRDETPSASLEPVLRTDDGDNSDPMTSVAAQSAIEMGYTEVTVKDAVRQLTQQTGSFSFGAVELVSLIMEKEENENQTHCPTKTRYEANNGTAHHEQTGCPQADSNTTLSRSEENLRSLMKENRQMREESLCRICCEESSCIVFLPCGHMTTCPRCARALTKCLVCRKVIQGSIRAYLP